MSGEHNQLKGAKPATPHTNRKGGYQKGEHLVVCDRSGRVYDSSNTRKEWNGLIVGKDEWEPRHPQEFVRGIRENIAVKQARPGGVKSIDLSTTIDDITPVSGSVTSSVYTSGAADDTRPFVYWTVDLGSSLELEKALLSGVSMTGAPPSQIRRGVKMGYSTDNVTYTDIEPALGEFSDGLEGGAADFVVALNITARYLRLALIGGAGLGYTGTLSMTGLQVTKDV